MPFPDIDGISFAEDQATVAAWLDRVAPARPPEVAAAVARLYQRVEQVSTKLYDDVQELKGRMGTVETAIMAANKALRSIAPPARVVGEAS